MFGPLKAFVWSAAVVAGVGNVAIAAIVISTLWPIPPGERIRPMGLSLLVLGSSVVTLALSGLLLAFAGAWREEQQERWPLRYRVAVVLILLIAAAPCLVGTMVQHIIDAFKGFEWAG
jgi:hypothetical protein